MSNYIVSARKYRPVSFSSVVGQSSLTTTLKNSIASGRLAHAYLFCGPRGVGKTTCARIFAKTINCLSPLPNGDACEQCESCKAFNEQRSYNIHELDAASNNGVEDIRQLIEQVNIPPQIGRYKVFIIDEVHMLSQAAFNAFLKTLEEPPAHAIFILATTEKHKLLPTILSRCQIYDFNRMSVQDIVGHLEHVAQQENIQFEPAALNVIAQKADGGMRDALSIFDQVASFCQGNITYQQTIADLNVLDHDYYFKIVDDCLSNNISDIMLTFNDILSKGFEGSHFIGGLNNHLRNLLVSRDAQTVKLLETSDDVRQRYAEQAQRCHPRFLYAAMRKCTDCDLNYRTSQNKRLLVELTLIEIAQIASGEADGNPSGLGPTKILKPIFGQATASRPAASPQGTATPNPAASPQGNSLGSRPAASPQGTATAPSTPPNISIPTTEAARPQRNTSVKGFSIRLSQTTAPAESVAPAATAETAATPAVTGEPIAASQLPLDPNNLIIAWKTFAQSLSGSEAALSAQMTGLTPVLQADGTTFTIEVSTPYVQKEFQRLAPRIVGSINQFFARNDLQMQVNISKGEQRQKVYSKLEQFNLMCEENPALSKLKDELELELG